MHDGLLKWLMRCMKHTWAHLCIVLLFVHDLFSSCITNKVYDAHLWIPWELHTRREWWNWYNVSLIKVLPRYAFLSRCHFPYSKSSMFHAMRVKISKWKKPHDRLDNRPQAAPKVTTPILLPLSPSHGSRVFLGRVSRGKIIFRKIKIYIIKFDFSKKKWPAFCYHWMVHMNITRLQWSGPPRSFFRKEEWHEKGIFTRVSWHKRFPMHLSTSFLWNLASNDIAPKEFGQHIMKSANN